MAEWVDAGGGYALSLSDGKLLCRNAKGKQLASVPKRVKESDAGIQLLALRDWLKEHQRECADTVSEWMLRSLPVPRRVLEAVWPDPSWQAQLANVVVLPVVNDRPDQDAAGFLRGADPARGLGVVDLDGESVWLDVEAVVLPHPILLEELDDFRELSLELGLETGLQQLFRETFARPDDLAEEATSIGDYGDGKFEQLNHVLGRCRTLGYRVRGGYATTAVWEGGHLIEARYWIGAEDLESEAYTGDLVWVDDRQKVVGLRDVGPVAFSEGMRMANAIYAKRVVDEEG